MAQRRRIHGIVPKLLLAACSAAITLAIGWRWLPISLRVAITYGDVPREIWLTGGVFSKDNPMGYRLPPRSLFRHYYPENSRGYFETDLVLDCSWRLDQLSSSSAALLLDRIDPNWVSVDVAGGNPERPWEINLSRSPFNLEAGLVELSLTAQGSAGQSMYVTLVSNKSRGEHLAERHDIVLGPRAQHFRFQFNLNQPGEAAIFFGLGEGQGRVELSHVELKQSSKTLLPERSTQSWPFYVEYRTNKEGFRDRDRLLPASASSSNPTHNIACLGDSFTFGQGVRGADLFSLRLEVALAQRARSLGRAPRAEVLNFGHCGWSTWEERQCYEYVVRSYLPDIVLLTYCVNDDQKFADDQRRAREAGLFGLFEPVDYSGSMNEIRLLHQACQRDGARFAVILFRHEPYDNWLAALSALKSASAKDGWPLLDLGEDLLRSPNAHDLRVDAADNHPNEIAHSIAARSIERFLDQLGWIDQQGAAVPLPSRPTMR